MNRIKFLLGLMVFALLVQAVGAQVATTVSVNPSYSNLNLEDLFTVAINISTTDPVYAVELKVYFDPSVLNVESIAEGDFLKKDGTFTSMKMCEAGWQDVCPKIDNALGKIEFMNTRLGGNRTTVSGTGNLFTIDFDTMGAGTSQIGMASVQLLDNNLNVLASTANNGSAKVNTPPTINAVVVSPNPAYTLDTLDCGFLVNDPDVLDTVKVNVTWLKNGAPWTEDDENEIVIASWENTSAQGDIEPGDTVKGDTWVCRATAYDELSEVTQDSSAVMIQNSLPILSVLPNQAMDEDENGIYNAIDLDTYSSDADGEALTYSIVSHSNPGLVAASIDGNYLDIAAPAQDQSGTNTVCVKANDGSADSNQECLDITINPVNDPPVLAGIPDKSTDEDTSPPDNWIDLYDYANDVDNTDPELTFTITGQTNPGLISCSIDSNRYVDCGTPAQDQTGFSDVTVQVSDPGSLTDTDTFRVTVNPVNDPPTQPGVDVTPDSPYTNNDLLCSIATPSDDADGDSITYTYEWYKNGELQPGLTTNTVGSANTAKNQVWKCRVTPNDGEANGPSGEDEVTILNSRPVASNLSLTPANPVTSDNLVGSYSYSDDDLDPESGSEIRWYKNGALESAYNDLSTVPSLATAKGEDWYFTIKPNDGTDFFGYLIFSPIVTIQNSPPELSPIGDKAVLETNTLAFTVSATDDDSDTLVYGTNAGFGTFNTNTGEFSWATGWYDAGFYTVIFNVTDGTETVEEVTTITVNNNNRPPSIDSYSPLAAVLNTRTGRVLSFSHTSSDQDLDDTLTYSWRVNETERAATQNWAFNPDPLLSDCGDREVKLVVTDSHDEVSQAWTVNVKLSGDVDLNGDVDIFDLAAVGLAYGSRPEDPNWNANADLHTLVTEGGPEGNGKIDIFDLATVGLNYGKSWGLTARFQLVSSDCSGASVTLTVRNVGTKTIATGDVTVTRTSPSGGSPALSADIAPGATGTITDTCTAGSMCIYRVMACGQSQEMYAQC